MSETGGAVVSRRARRDYTVAEKLCMVKATLEPGSSVARVAQANDVNPNLIFVWRKQHREGRLIDSGRSELRLLPVSVTDTPAQTISRRTSEAPAQAGTLHVELPRGRVRIEGADAASLRVVLEMLLR